jgi:beta-fructofuranosidase
MSERGPGGPADTQAPALWSPCGRFVWDTWFARQGGRLHAFYLEAPVAACGGDPERRHDLASIGHATLSPGGWEEVGPALAAATGPGWDDLALWTGSIVEARPWAPFALFYTARRRSDAPVATPHELQRPQQVGLALSDDLRTWRRSRRSEDGPVLPNPGRGPFDGVAWRDPHLRRREGSSRGSRRAGSSDHEGALNGLGIGEP